MLIELDDEQRLLQETARKFVQKEVAHRAEEMDHEDKFPMDLFLKMGELGFLGITVPEEYGGSGSGLLSQAIVIEELAKASAGLASSYAAHSNLVADNLNRHANEAQKKKYLPDLCTGKKIGCLAITEPCSGSDALAMTTKAIWDGGFYVLNGTKTFITNGPVADIIMKYAKTAPNLGSHGISTFILEKDYPGFSVGKKIEKMGHRGSPFSELVFEDCRVPAENMVGEVNSMVRMVLAGLHRERVIWSAEAVGIAQGAYEIAKKYATEREQFGQPIIEFQMIQEKLVQMAMEVHIGRMLVYRSALMADMGRNAEVGLEASYAKLYACDMSERVAGMALHILGGYGYTREYQVERYFRDAKAMPIGAGTSETQRLIIARKLFTR